MKGSSNAVIKILFKCLQCCFLCLERFLKMLNNNAWVEVRHRRTAGPRGHAPYARCDGLQAILLADGGGGGGGGGGAGLRWPCTATRSASRRAWPLS